MLRHLALTILLAALPFGAAHAGAPEAPPLDRKGPVAFLGLAFLDTSTEGAYFGAREDETARLALLRDEVARRFRSEGFTLMDLPPVAAELEATVNPAKCYGCDLRMGRKLGAAYVLEGEVQKVSNLILSMNLVLLELPEGRMVRGRSVDIRSNTDESWLRGIRYILDNHYFGKE
ncbi:DUF3280 domain-containing protein [Rhodovulum kholense]|uniref:Uncharacterized protein DUF2380 n=1 Tax=Rhodovulum kholense TaxID=453584 RepID=A0A8E2VGB7_9RHOB|nr:DUF3280 domain-containing protein [Rhodovulum kholense]PTW42403.1 uncharacterized protein DUF2380 [Rhodovulum kholense]